MAKMGHYIRTTHLNLEINIDSTLMIMNNESEKYLMEMNNREQKNNELTIDLMNVIKTCEKIIE